VDDKRRGHLPTSARPFILDSSFCTGDPVREGGELRVNTSARVKSSGMLSFPESQGELAVQRFHKPGGPYFSERKGSGYANALRG